MKYIFLGFAVLLAAPMVSKAQETILDYQGATMTGTTTYLQNDVVFSAPIAGIFTASITLDGSVAANDLTLVSYAVNFGGTALNVPGASTAGPLAWVLSPGELVLTTSDGTIDGAITGAFLDIPNHSQKGTTSDIVIGPSGDSYDYEWGSVNGSCLNLALLGGPDVSPCSVVARSTSAGTWTVEPQQAPEIDPASAASGLTLLLGGVAVLRGRRKMNH